MAHLAYFDESGDSGLVNSPTRYFVLACVLVPESTWMANLDLLIRLRKGLRDRYGVPTRQELKSTDIRRGRGPLTGLHFSPSDRQRLFKRLMLWQDRTMIGLNNFAVVMDKALCAARGREPRETAWEFALQRVDTFCRKADSKAILFPDEGHGPFIKRLTRRKRRFQKIPGRFGGTLSIPLERVLEDPNDRRSHDSYFIQLADWNAYAALRSSHVEPRAPGVDPTAWDALGGTLLTHVNRVRGGPPGIVLWP